MNKRIVLPVILVFFLVIGLVSTVGCASAKFEVNQLTITPSKVVAGETFTVTAKISNVGDAVGVYSAVLTINGIERATKDIAIIAGGTQELVFTLEEENPGNYRIALADKTLEFDVIKILTFEQQREATVEYLRAYNEIDNDLDSVLDSIISSFELASPPDLLQMNKAFGQLLSAYQGGLHRTNELKAPTDESSAHLQAYKKWLQDIINAIQSIQAAISSGTQATIAKTYGDWEEAESQAYSMNRLTENLMAKYNIPDTMVNYKFREVTAEAQAGETKAAETELANVQSAVVAMMVDNGISQLPNPVTKATLDMGAFPGTSVCGVDKLEDPNGKLYIRGQDKSGYLLYGHDITADGDNTLLVDYLTVRYTMGTYTVDKYGTVTQVTTGYE